MLTHFKIDYSNFNDDASPIKDDVKVKLSHSKLVANYNIAKRNQDIKFREKVSNGVKKFFGDAKERFFSKITKIENGCWNYPHRTIMDGNKKEILSKVYSSKIHNLGFTKEIVYQICGNNKCVNPEHLVEMTREEQALHTVKIRKTNTKK